MKGLYCLADDIDDPRRRSIFDRLNDLLQLLFAEHIPLWVANFDDSIRPQHQQVIWCQLEFRLDTSNVDSGKSQRQTRCLQAMEFARCMFVMECRGVSCIGKSDFVCRRVECHKQKGNEL